MKKSLSRRDFIKLGALLPFAYSLSPIERTIKIPGQTPGKQNVLFILFDALSAYHLPFHGYPRETTPNLTRFLERATVYHNHIAGGNFTYPGVASLLTGAYTWTNRAFNPSTGFVKDVRVFRQQNVFGLFDQYYRFVYTHNPFAFKIIRDFLEELDDYVNPEELFLDHDFFVDNFFSNDDDTASIAWLQGMRSKAEGTSYSLLLSTFYELYKRGKLGNFAESYPRGVPSIREDSYFVLEDAIDWTPSQISAFPQPFLAYFHFFPPHAPYRTRKEYVDAFRGDGLKVIEKPEHVLARPSSGSWDYFLLKRRLYDEFILLVDHEFGRLFNILENSGVLDNTWVILTSDHGELFERGYWGHMHASLHHPVLKIPLIIFAPGQTSRNDIFVPTSAVDVLPTLLHVTDQPIPDWSEGEVLPPFRKDELDSQRSIFALEAKKSAQFGEITPASSTIIKGNYKLHYYYGYDELKDIGSVVELYDIENDPEEMNNLKDIKTDVASELLNELINRMESANAPYLDD
jgi:arylsulfatase A-like enzyme